MRAWGDEDGFMWQQPIRVGKTSATGQNKGPTVRQKRPLPPPPENYSPPIDFPMFNTGERISLDIETYDPDLKAKGPGFKRNAYIVGVAVRTESWEGNYYPVQHANGPNCDKEQVFRWLRDNFKDMPRGTEVTGTNPMYDAEGLEVCAGVDFERVKWRPVDFADPLLDENHYKYNLNAIGMRRVGKGKVRDELKELYGDDYITHFQDVHPGHAHAYGMGDIDLPLEILPVQEKLLEKEGLLNLFDLECRLMPFMLYLRRTGVRVDVPAATKFNDILDGQLTIAKKTMRDISGVDCGPWEAQGIARGFDKLGLAYPKTEKGNASFTAPWLENHPSPYADAVLACRKIEKFKGTFIESYILNCHMDGRVFGQFHQMKGEDGGTVTGRFSSSNPDLQNIPIRDEVLGPLVRGLYIPEDGTKWWSLDYSQIEYRLLVHYAMLARCIGAKAAADMYWSDPNTDFHVLVALLTGLNRKAAKNINFGFVYGMGVVLLAAKLGMLDAMGRPTAEAHEIFSKYHNNAPFIKQVYEMASQKAQDAGCVRTILDRKRRFNLYEPWGYWKQTSDEPKPHGTWEKTNQRQGKDAARPPALHFDAAKAFYCTDNLKRAYTHKALNAVLQGSAADMMKKAMVDVWESGAIGPGRPLQCHLTVHDELDGSMEDTPQGHEALEAVRQIMIEAIPLKVPVLVSGSTGKNWAEAK